MTGSTLPYQPVSVRHTVDHGYKINATEGLRAAPASISASRSIAAKIRNTSSIPVCAAIDSCVAASLAGGAGFKILPNMRQRCAKSCAMSVDTRRTFVTSRSMRASI